MKFMITWQFHQGKLHEGYSQFFKMTPEQDAADRGSRIKQIEARRSTPTNVVGYPTMVQTAAA